MPKESVPRGLALFGSRLLKARKAAGLTQEQTAEKIGYSRHVVSHTESGQQPPGPSLTERLATRLSRQEIFRAEAPPAYWVILDEAVLLRVIGGPVVMHAQLAHIVEMMRHVDSRKRRRDHSADEGARPMTFEPVRAGFAWRKSTYSGDNGGECVELATVPDGCNPCSVRSTQYSLFKPSTCG